MTMRIDVLPRTQFAGPFTQSTFQSLNTGDFQTATLQVWVDGMLNPPPGGSDKLQVVVQDADFNEERDFGPSDNPTWERTADGSATLRLAIPKRFLRLEIIPTLTGGAGPTLAINVRARLLLDG